MVSDGAVVVAAALVAGGLAGGARTLGKAMGKLGGAVTEPMSRSADVMEAVQPAAVKAGDGIAAIGSSMQLAGHLASQPWWGHGWWHKR